MQKAGDGRPISEELQCELDALLMTGQHAADRPLFNDGTFSVGWKGRWEWFGNRLTYRLLKRLCKRPGHYVHFDDLKQEVWNDDFTNDSAISRQASHLRNKLREVGFQGIEIDGSQKHCLRVVLGTK